VCADGADLSIGQRFQVFFRALPLR
jgi:hypothetical protein